VCRRFELLFAPGKGNRPKPLDEHTIYFNNTNIR